VKYSLCFFVCIVYFSIHLFSQTPDTSDTEQCHQRQILTASALGTAYVGVMTGLYELWYKDYPQSSFHFFNDNSEWLQMDKAGHFYSAYHLGEFGYHASRFSCVPEIKAVWLGGATGLLFLTGIEVFDGFSAGWGASWGDMMANTAGYLLFAGQQHFWKQQRFRLKYSYFPSVYAEYRPDVLGNSFASRLLKDYNAQTLWLSFSPATFAEHKNSVWPKWLCFSFGYSADGMIGGTMNPTEVNGQIIPAFNRQRQFYMSLDVDFSSIKSNLKIVKILLYGLNMVKVPFPAFSYSSYDKVQWHLLYF
jgi:uncharacterized protein YfiM (DUF2279 family)